MSLLGGGQKYITLPTAPRRKLPCQHCECDGRLRTHTQILTVTHSSIFCVCNVFSAFLQIFFEGARSNGGEDCAVRSFVASFFRRLIGTIQRAYLDQVPFWSARDLKRKLLMFKNITIEVLLTEDWTVPPDKKAGITDRTIARLNDYRCQKCCRGLYQLPAAA